MPSGQHGLGLAAELPPWATKAIAVVAAFCVLGGLVFVSILDWGAFTNGAIMLSVSIAWAVFSVAWSAHRYRAGDNSFFFLLGTSLFFVSLLSLASAAAARRGSLDGFASNEAAAQLWLASRWLQSATVLSATVLIYSRPHPLQRKPWFPYLVLAVFGIVTLGLAYVGFSGLLPACLGADAGYTPFYRASEGLSAMLLAASLLHLWRKRDQFDREIMRWLTAALVGMMCTDLALVLPTQQVSVTLSYLFLVSSAFAFYRAAIATAIKRPQDLLFRALSQSEAHHRSLVEHTPDILLRVDRQCRVQFANAAIDKLLPPGATNADITTLLKTGFADGGVAPCDLALARAFETNTVQFNTFTWGRGADHAVYDVRMVPEVEPDGKVATVLCMLRDVTVQRAVERDYQLLFDSTPAGFIMFKVIYDEGGQPCDYQGLAINAAAERIFHDTVNRMDTMRSLRSALQDAAALAALDRVAISGEAAQFETQLASEDVHLSVTAHAPEPGVLACIVVDISERVHAEAKLQQTLRALERSNSDLERFAYVASHDLQEPLRMVTAYTQLLADRYGDQLDGDASEFIGYAQEGALRMRGLIQDLLAYSRVTSRGQDPQPTDAGQALVQALARLEFGIHESGAVVTTDELPVVNVDGVQLEQLFQNLIGNAIKYRGPEPPRIHVSAESGAGEWVFSVRDNGIGIDPAFHERIFVIFQRLHARDEYPGTGIGLAICESIVRRHGGRIWVESVLNQGSNFRFTLPCAPFMP